MNTTKQAQQGQNLERKRAVMLQQVSEDAPSKVGVFRSAYGGKSLRAAVNAQCLMCCWMDVSAIRDCTAPSCPLFAVRPFQRKSEAQP